MKRTIIGWCADAWSSVLRRVAVGGAVVFPWAACASTQTATNAASTGPDLSGVGRVLGMILFAYLVLKWFNRKKDKDDDETRGVLGRSVKPWVVWLVVIGGLAWLMVQSG